MTPAPNWCTGSRAPQDVVTLNRNLAGLTAYCDGWAHDDSWLGALFEEAGLQPPFKLEAVSVQLDGPQLAQLDPLERAAFMHRL